MAKLELPSQSDLRQLLDYDPETGAFTHRSGPNKGLPACYTTSQEGYLRGSVNGRVYAAHRLAWRWMTGQSPDCIDHINGDIRDNRFLNLRAANRTVNARNRKRPATNKSGQIGVFWLKRQGTWVAYITVNGRRLTKYFQSDKDAAIRWRKEMEAAHGFHPNHGRTARG